MNVIRKYMKFFGNVQGVGFRYRAQKSASLYDVTGWVRNNYDGSVEMEAQGKSELINQLIEEMKNVSNYIVIDNIEQKVIPIKEGETEFIIAY